MDGAEQLIPSGRSSTGYKGVRPSRGRFQATCTTPPCSNNYLGIFDIPEDAAQSYLQHWEEKHPEELAKERAPPPPPPVLLEGQHHLLIRSDKNTVVKTLGIEQEVADSRKRLAATAGQSHDAGDS